MLKRSYLLGGCLVIVLAGMAMSACSSDDGATPGTGNDAGPEGGPNAESEAGADGGGAPDWGPKKSGSRIAVREVHGTDGSRVFSDLFDKKLGVTCSLLVAEDGKLRCMPDTLNQVDYYFEDDQCTRRVATRVRDFCPRSEYARTWLEDCDSVAYYRATPAKPAKVYNKGDTCVASTPSPYRDHFVAEKTDPTEFVSFARVSEPLGSGVSARRLVGDDGTKTFDGQLFDDARGKPCRAKQADDGTTRCVPDSKHVEDQGLPPQSWAEACVSRVAWRSCQTTRIEFDDTVVATAPSMTSSGCDMLERANIATRGASMEGNTTYRCWEPCDPASCTAYPGGGDQSRIGSALPPATFPSLTVDVRGVGGPRLKALTTLVGNAPVWTERLRDAEFGRCTFRTAADGALRCLPDNYRVEYWLDSTCSAKPLAVGDSTCEAPKYATLASGKWCEPTAKGTVHALSGPMSTTGLTYYTMDPVLGDCFQVDESVRNPPSVVYPLGDEVPPSTFVEGTLVEW